MVRPDVAKRKIARSLDWLDRCAKILARPVDELRADELARDAAAFYFFLAVQEAIDLAAHWVADEGWTPPDDVGSTFDVIAAHHGIAADLATEMRNIVRVRNRIAHGYSTVDHERFQVEAPGGIATVKTFLADVSKQCDTD